jgi:hypothetical protein
VEVSLHPRLRGFDPRSHAIQTGSVRIKTAQDGGGKARAALKTIRGVELVTRFISGIWQRYLSELDYRLASINGETGIVAFAGERPVWALTIETDGARILAAFAIVNPDKLKGIAPENLNTPVTGRGADPSCL